jgi:hypothetical protein
MIQLFFTVEQFFTKYNWNWQNQKVDPLESGPPVLPKRNFPSSPPPPKKGNWNRTRNPVKIPIFKLSLLNQSGTGPIHGRQLGGAPTPRAHFREKVRIFKKYINRPIIDLWTKRRVQSGQPGVNSILSACCTSDQSISNGR